MELLREHPEELEADLWDHRVDLDDVMAGRFGLRKACTLTAHLPPGSRVWVAMNLDDAWSFDEYLLALVADRLRGESEEPLKRPADLRKQQQSAEKFASQVKQSRTASAHFAHKTAEFRAKRNAPTAKTPHGGE